MRQHTTPGALVVVWLVVYLQAGGAALLHRSQTILHDCFQPYLPRYRMVIPIPEHVVNDFHSPYSPHHIQRPPMGASAPALIRGNSDTAFGSITPQPPPLPIPRTTSDVMLQQPKPVQAGQYVGQRHGRVQWKIGSES